MRICKVIQRGCSWITLKSIYINAFHYRSATNASNTTLQYLVYQQWIIPNANFPLAYPISLNGTKSCMDQKTDEWTIILALRPPSQESMKCVCFEMNFESTTKASSLNMMVWLWSMGNGLRVQLEFSKALDQIRIPQWTWRVCKWF